MNNVLIFIALLIYPVCSFSQSFWKVENEYGDQIMLTFVINDENKTFVAHTRKNALKDIAGSFTYALAKTAGKLKHAEIVYIEGNTQRKTESLLLSGIFYYFDKQFRFEASISGNNFDGKYIDNKNRSHPLTGIKVQNNRPINDYPSIINTAILLTEKYLFNSVWLKSDEWLSFRHKIIELKSRISDDYEIVATFYWLGKNLPFSPYEISKINPHSKSTGRQKEIWIRELKPGIVFIDANSLPVNVREMDSIALIVERKGYNKLIIDLRGKSKIIPEVTEILINYLSSESFHPGIYLTRRWFNSNKIIPESQDYKKSFSSFSDNNYSSGEIYRESGRYLNIVPREKTYNGKVFVLTDSKTSGVSESLIYILKNQKLATVVGQRTSGSSFLAEKLIINDVFSLNLLVSDYYTSEGKSLNKTGIEPDIIVSGQDALEFMLKTL
jgi:hypothetical protein